MTSDLRDHLLNRTLFTVQFTVIVLAIVFSSFLMTQFWKPYVRFSHSPEWNGIYSNSGLQGFLQCSSRIFLVGGPFFLTRLAGFNPEKIVLSLTIRL